MNTNLNFFHHYKALGLLLVCWSLAGFGSLYGQDITHPTTGTNNVNINSGDTRNYYDSGGADCDTSTGEYSSNEDGITVLCPTTSGDIITLEFLDVDIESRSSSDNCWDFLSVYNGNSTSATQLIEGCGEEGFPICPGGTAGDGGDCGGVEDGSCDIDGSNDSTPNNNIFTSTATNGCLTVEFDSDGSLQEGGWVATVSANEPATCSITNLSVTNIRCGEGFSSDDAYIDVSFDVVGGSGNYFVAVSPVGSGINYIGNNILGEVTDGTINSIARINVGGLVGGDLAEVLILNVVGSCTSSIVTVTVPVCPLCPAVGGLVITEIMQNPTGDDNNGEWFEVYNAGPNQINMKNMVISDDGTNAHTIADDLLVNPGQYVVLTNNEDSGTNGNFTANYEYSGFTLANGDDEIILTCQGTEIDRVDYDGGPAFPDPEGASMQLNPDNIDADDNDDANNWCEADTNFGDGDQGTPGSANTDCCIGEAPVITCTNPFTFSYNRSAPPPNTPSGSYGDLPADGLLTLLLGFPGGEFETIDFSQCIDDDDEDYSEYGILLVSSILGTASSGCGETLTNTYNIRGECEDVAEDEIVIIATFNDGQAPTVSCTDFTATFNDCPSGLGPNTPNGNWSPVPPSGTFLSAVGGSYSTTVDLNACVSDDVNSLDELEYTLNDSYTEAITAGCSITLVNEIAIRDACGNVADDFVYVKITISNTDNTTPPSITCPANTTIECGSSTDPMDTGMATGNAACGNAAIDFSDDFTASGCSSATGTIVRTWTATDGCGLVSSCEQTITLVDNTAPVVTCTDFTMTFEGCPRFLGPNTPTGSWFAIGADGGFTAASGGSFTMFLDLSTCITDGCSDLADLEVTLFDSYEENRTDCSVTLVNEVSVRDECGNVAEDRIITRFTIENTSPAVIVCPATQDIACGSSTDPADTGMATATDACGDVDVTFSDEITMRCNAGSYAIIRTWSTVGSCGTPASCEQLIILRDLEAPMFDAACQVDDTFFTEAGELCPADATISLSEGDELNVNDTWTVGGNTMPSLAGCLSDNCAIEDEIVITVDDITVTGDGTCTQTFAVTFIADDGCGNDSDPFTFSYTFIDNTAPVFDLACQFDEVFTTNDGNVCPADAFFSLSEGDEIDVFTGWSVGGIAIPSLQGCVEDNCINEADLTITVDDITVVDDGTCSRTITVTFIADDGCGNFSDPFVCNYTFIDNTGPEVSFNGIPDGGTFVIECDLPSTTWDPLTDIGELTLSDNCSVVDVAGITEELTQLYDGPCQGNVLTRWQQVFTVMDVCGNTTVYTLFTEIIDTTPPVFETTPDDITIECDEMAEMPEIVTFDSCSDVTIDFTEVRTDGSCPNSYTLTRTWTATDGCGNASNEVQIITVEDTTPPEIEFIDGYINQYEADQDVFIDCTELGNIMQLISNNAIATDNCSGNTPVEYRLEDLGNFDCVEYGYIGRFVSIWESKDECGNSSVATINWYLVDETAPIFQNVPADVCAGTNLPPVADVQAVDECDYATVNFHQSEPIDCDGGQYIERIWTAFDPCGNTAMATQRITLAGGANGPSISIDYPEIGDVNDGDLIQLPIDCSQDIAFSVEELEAAISINAGCGSGDSEIELILMDEGDCTENGYFARYQLNITASDPCGNTANFGLMIDFVDGTGPVVSSPAAITLNCGDDIPTIMASDACGEVASITFVDSEPIQTSCSADPVPYQRIWTVADACGNVTTFLQKITIIDSDGPTLMGVPHDACNNLVTDAIVTSIDACTGEEAEVMFTEEATNEAGCGQVITRTWTTTDACGNTSTATQQVFFDDEIAPMISFSNDLLFGLESGDELFLNVGNGYGDPNDPMFFTSDDVMVNDNCATLTADVTIATIHSDDCAADGYLARYDYLFTATDPCGNSSTAKLAVFYLDNNAPDFFNTPADVEVFCSTIPDVAEIIVSDDYDQDVDVMFNETQTSTVDGVLITRTWTATDDCGNANSFDQEILVVDNDLAASFSFGSTVIECNSDNNRLGVTVMGGTAPYTYEWQLTSPLEDGYITTDPTLRAILFTMGYITQTFSVLITDANGCELLASVTVVCDFSNDEGNFLISNSDSNDPADMLAYPNPAKDYLRLKSAQLVEKRVDVRLYNLYGQEVLQQKVGNWPQEGYELNTNRLPNGTYLLRVMPVGEEPISIEVVILR